MRSGPIAALALAGACGRIGFDAGVAGTTDDGMVAVLTVSPAAPTINVGSKVAFQVGGGTPPYALTADTGTVQNLTFVAPTEAGTTIVHASDTDGRTADVTVTYRGDHLFVAGGDVSGAIDASVLTTTDGITWTTAGNLPAPRANGALVVYDDRLYYLG